MKQVYTLCESLPKVEQRNLTDQRRRACVSIALNIAEGSAAESSTEYKRYLYISKKSQVECIAMLKILTEVYGINTIKEIEKAEEIGKMLQGLITYLRKPV